MPKQGQRIGPYTLIRKLGQGSFGGVWLAERRSVIATTQVAIKIPNDDDVNLDAVQHEAGYVDVAAMDAVAPAMAETSPEPSALASVGPASPTTTPAVSSGKRRSPKPHAIIWRGTRLEDG